MSDPDLENTSRRGFLQVSAGAVASVCAGCHVFIGNRSSDVSMAPDAQSKEVALALAKYPKLDKPGGQLVVEVGGDDEEVLVFRRKDGELAAVNLSCTHQGCDVDYVVETDEIDCPCHGSRFAVADGKVLEGPAEDPLKTYAIRVEGESVIIELGKSNLDKT